MAEPLLSFRAKASHGALIVRGLQAKDDISDWDPTTSNWHQVGQSVIFGVLPDSEGPTEFEVWTSRPGNLLPTRLFETNIAVDNGWLVVHDPNEHIRMEFHGKRGQMAISARGDDLECPSKVQLIFAD